MISLILYNTSIRFRVHGSHWSSDTRGRSSDVSEAPICQPHGDHIPYSQGLSPYPLVCSRDPRESPWKTMTVTRLNRIEYSPLTTKVLLVVTSVIATYIVYFHFCKSKERLQIDNMRLIICQLVQNLYNITLLRCVLRAFSLLFCYTYIFFLY